MPAPEKLIIDTPEQIALEFPLAGIGSRFLALAFDTFLQFSALVLLGILALVARWAAAFAWPSLGTWAVAVLLCLGFVIYSGYFALFETMWRGQTPGKRRVGLRVIDVSGRPLGVYAAVIRNLVRIVDQLPGIYAIGILSMLISSRQQRLGDLAAGTVVVHERPETIVPLAAAAPQSTRHGAHRLTPEEVLVIEAFLQRRDALDPWMRLTRGRRIAQRMAATLGLDAPADEERFLEQLAGEYRSADRQR